MGSLRIFVRSPPANLPLPRGRVAYRLIAFDSAAAGRLFAFMAVLATFSTLPLLHTAPESVLGVIVFMMVTVLTVIGMEAFHARQQTMSYVWVDTGSNLMHRNISHTWSLAATTRVGVQHSMSFLTERVRHAHTLCNRPLSAADRMCPLSAQPNTIFTPGHISRVAPFGIGYIPIDWSSIWWRPHRKPLSGHDPASAPAPAPIPSPCSPETSRPHYRTRIPGTAAKPTDSKQQTNHAAIGHSLTPTPESEPIACEPTEAHRSPVRKLHQRLGKHRVGSIYKSYRWQVWYLAGHFVVQAYRWMHPFIFRYGYTSTHTTSPIHGFANMTPIRSRFYHSLRISHTVPDYPVVIHHSP